MIECNRTLSQAKRDFSSGLLQGAVLMRVPMSKTEWTVRLRGGKGDFGMLLDALTLAPQVFQSLDKAVQTVEQIGFSFDHLMIP